MYYKLDGNEERFDSVDDVLDYCVDIEHFTEDTESFDSWLDESEGEICVRGWSFAASAILYEMNHDAYVQELAEWANDEVESYKNDYRPDVENLVPGGDPVYLCGYTIRAFDDDEDEDEDEEEAADDDNAERLKSLEEKLASEKAEQAELEEQQAKTEVEFLSALGIEVNQK